MLERRNEITEERVKEVSLGGLRPAPQSTIRSRGLEGGARNHPFP